MIPKNSKVIFTLLDSPAFGGAEQYLHSQLNFLNQQGFDVVLATNNLSVQKELIGRLQKNQHSYQIINAPYRLDAIGNWKGLVKFLLALPASCWWCFTTLRRLNQEYKTVICLWGGFSDRLVFSPIAHYLKCRLIWVEIGPLEPVFRRNFGFPKLLYWLAQRYPAKVVTTSQFTKQSLTKNSRFTSQDIALVYPGAKYFSAAQIRNYKNAAQTLRTRLGWQRVKIMGIVARLADENEISNVVSALAIFKRRWPQKNVQLLIIGDGPSRADLQKQVKKLNLQHEIFFAGFVSEKAKYLYLSACDFFIFPRAWAWDGFGMTTIEAMSLGLPVLTTDFGPQVEIVTNGREGFRYEPRKPSVLAEYMYKMCELNRVEIQKMGRYSLRRAKDFSLKKSNESMLEVVRAVEHS